MKNRIRTRLKRLEQAKPWNVWNLALALLLFWTTSASAQLIRREFIDPLLGAPILYANLPGSPRTGDTYWVSDVNSGCTTGGSTNNVVVGWSGTAWICLGSVGAGAGSQSLAQVLAIGKTDTTLNSEANALKLGDGTRRIDQWCDATDGCVRKPNPLADTTIPAWTGKIIKFRDMAGGINMMEWDPAAATQRDKYKYTAPSHRPWKQISLPVGYFKPDGTHCTDPSDALISGTQHRSTTCAVAAGAELRSRQILMNRAWDRGAVRLAAVMADPDGAGNATGDVYVQCRGSGEAPADVWSSAAAVDITFATADAQTTSAVTGDITPSGTCGASPLLWIEWRMDNGNWTAGTNTRILGFDLWYREEAWSAL